MEQKNFHYERNFVGNLFSSVCVRVLERRESRDMKMNINVNERILDIDRRPVFCSSLPSENLRTYFSL